jgi:type VI secretion system protein ImpH
MAAPRRLEGAAVSLATLEHALLDNPSDFEFFQAVRLLERLLPDRAPVGGFADPSTEVVRFSVNPRIAFPPGSIDSLKMIEDGPAEMRVNFMGLVGASGVLPYAYSLLVAERTREDDPATADFFDLFHHRIISLFYRAWQKHRFTVASEKGEEDRLREHLLDLIGAGLDSMRDLLPVPDGALLYHAGLLALRQRGALSLQQLLEDYFDVPVEIEQFVGGWYPLPRRDQCEVGGDEELSNGLGLGAVVGDEIWDQQARVRVRLGPLDAGTYARFLPTGDAHASLRALTRYFSDDQFDFEVQLVLARGEVRGFVLGGDEEEASQPLGWATWIRSADLGRDPDDTVLVL